MLDANSKWKKSQLISSMQKGVKKMKWLQTKRPSLKVFALSIFGLCLIGFSNPALAVNFSFSGSDEGGTGSATMNINIVGNTLTLLLDNTSPTSLDDNTGVNTPGITGFGFNLTDPIPGLDSWSLTAFNTDGSGPVTIGANVGGTGDWVMNTSVAQITLDFLPTAGDPAQIKGALYNPAATEGFGALPNYVTTATLTMNFLSAPVLDSSQCGPGGFGDCITYVRFQNVGVDGEGSLHLPGTTGTNGVDGATGQLPEPGTVLLFGSGLAGFGMWRLFRKQ
jgi:hypothetical protein